MKDEPFIVPLQQNSMPMSALLSSLGGVDEQALRAHRAETSRMDHLIQKLHEMPPEQRLEERRRGLAGGTYDREYAKLQSKHCDSVTEVLDWALKPGLTLQANECSRLHKLADAIRVGNVIDVELDQEAPDKFAIRSLDEGMGNPAVLAGAEVFVVRHDWAAVVHLEESDYDAPMPLPAPLTCFEFKVSNRVVLFCGRRDEHDEGKVNWCLLAEARNDTWVCMLNGAIEAVWKFCHAQARAIVVALDAQVVEHQVVRQPEALNRKRVKSGKAPLYDFHVLDISRRRPKAAPSGDPSEPTGVRRRLHFCRGHWRHYEARRVWIRWCLKGDPDLGFVDKEYRL